MKLDLNIDRAVTRGRRALPLEFEVVRPIDEADIAMLQTPAETQAPALKRLTDRHHSLARLLASGTPEAEAAAIVGYTLPRVSILKNDPAFQELLALYREGVEAVFATNLDHMAGAAKDALLELRDRLEEAPEKVTFNELRGVIVDFQDRVVRDSTSSDQRLPDIIELVAPQVSPQEDEAGPADDEGGERDAG